MNKKKPGERQALLSIYVKRKNKKELSPIIKKFAKELEYEHDKGKSDPS